MSDYTITLPEALYERVRRLAEQTARPIEEVIRTRLEQSLDEHSLDLPVDEQAELRALMALSDEALWTIAREQMATDTQRTMQALMDKNTFGTLTATEHEDLTHLVAVGQQLTLRKAEAMRLLMNRGHKINPDMLKPTS
ncbi:hypothetical protein HC776_03635 [bacterium]|nr:hypothetical protein [bacterium]